MLVSINNIASRLLASYIEGFTFYLVFDWSDSVLSPPVHIVGICIDVEGWFRFRWRENVSTGFGAVCSLKICAIELQPFSFTLHV